jgi:hypothetical protein
VLWRAGAGDPRILVVSPKAAEFITEIKATRMCSILLERKLRAGLQKLLVRSRGPAERRWVVCLLAY